MIAYIQKEQLLIGLNKKEVILKLGDEFNDPNTDLLPIIGFNPT